MRYNDARYRAAIRRARRVSRRYGSRTPLWQKAAAVAAASVALSSAAGAAAHAHHHHAHPAPASLAALPASADLSTRPGWARAFLAAIPEPVTACNLSAVLEWEAREDGGFGNQAAFNPLNVNPGPGAPWPGYSAIGAWAFPDARTGLDYSVQTIENGNYGAILAALHAGHDAQAVCDAIENSPWATSHYGYTLEASC